MKNLILKTSLLVYFLSTIVSAHAQTTKLPPLQLQKGDQFSYKFKTTIESDSCEHILWLTLKVIDVNRSDYEMEITIDRQNITNPSEKYYSRSAFNNQLIAPLLTVPITYTLSKSRQVQDLKIPSEAIENIINNSADTDFMLTMLLKSFYEQFESEIKLWVETIFTSWDKVDSRTNEMILTKTKTANEYKVQYGFEADSCSVSKFVIENPHSSILEKMDIDGYLSVLPDNGMPTKIDMKLNRSDLLESTLYETKNKININQSNHNDSIKIVVKFDDDHTDAEMHFFIHKGLFIDSDLIDWKTNIEGGKTYSHTQVLSRPTALAFTVNPSSLHNFPFLTSNFLLEPGDSITIHFENREITFSGTGSLKNTIKHHLIWSPLQVSKQASANEAKQIFQEKSQELFNYLESQKDNLSEWAYQQLRADIYFSYLNQLMAYYNPNIYSVAEDQNIMTNDKTFSILFGLIEWDKYACETSFEMRKFASNYLNEKGKIIKGSKKNRYRIPDQQKYYLADIILNNEARYLAQTNIVWKNLTKNNTQVGKQLFEDYKKKYWHTEFYDRLNKIYTNGANLTKDSTFPEVTFNTVDNKSISTSQLKGKFIQLLFVDFDLSEDRLEHELIEAFQGLRGELNEKHFELVTVFSSPDEDKIREYIQKYNLKGLLISNPNWINKDLKQFELIGGIPNFLLDPDGTIIMKSLYFPSDDSNRYIKQLINQTDFSAYEASISQRTLYGVLLLSLLVIAIIIMVSIVVTRNIKRKETMQRQKLEWQISAVRSQLNPHFLFNAMNSIQFLVNQNENKKANLFLSSFAKLMRKVLYQAEEEFTSLENELDTIQKYLELEQLRHKFTFHIEVDPAIDLYNTEIPVMLIQPFVENAILHGIAELKEKGRIEISIKQVNQNQLKICISDNGVGLSDKVNQSSTQSNGKGMHLTQKRMDLMMQKYRKEITFEVNDRKLQDASTNGTLVNINIETEA